MIFRDLADAESKAWAVGRILCWGQGLEATSDQLDIIHISSFQLYPSFRSNSPAKIPVPISGAPETRPVTRQAFLRPRGRGLWGARGLPTPPGPLNVTSIIYIVLNFNDCLQLIHNFPSFSFSMGASLWHCWHWCRENAAAHSC